MGVVYNQPGWYTYDLWHKMHYSTGLGKDPLCGSFTWEHGRVRVKYFQLQEENVCKLCYKKLDRLFNN